MSRPVPLRLLALLLAPLLVFLTACGSDSSDDEKSSKAGSVTVSGDFGKEPGVEFGGELKPEKITTEVLVEGDGEEIKPGTDVSVNVWLGNGSTQEGTYNTYETGTPEKLTAPEKADDTSLFGQALVGRKMGSRILVTASAADAFGEAGNPQLGIGNGDSVVMVLDLMGEYEPPKPPKATDVPASKQPKLVEKKGNPTGFDFSGIAKPKTDGTLLRTVLKEGKGKKVTTDMTVKVNYLGAVYQGKKPFDESYSREPVEFPLTGVVSGWTGGLNGVKVGSRVLLSIPPALGYGEQEQAGIPANSTLYFVVDVISAKK